jgi:hypothetical protein
MINSITQEQINDIISSHGSKTHAIFGQNRQVGKTTTGLVLAVHHAASNGNFHAVVICPANTRSRHKLDVVRELLAVMGIKYSVKNLEITFGNDSQISFCYGVPRGVEVDLVFYDDFEFIDSLVIPRNVRYVYLSTSLYQLEVL